MNIDTTEATQPTETAIGFIPCCTLADYTHETNHEEQKIKNAKRGAFKICVKCGSKLPATVEFWHIQKAGKYGLRSKCKKCSCDEMKDYRKSPEIKEKHRIKMIEWRKKNPEKTLEISRKNYKIHGEKHNQKKKEKYWTDKEYRLKCIAYDIKYKESGKRLESNSKKENREAARLRSKIRRQNETKKEQDYKRNAKWREENKEHIQELWKSNREELKPAYVAQAMRLKVKDLTPEILQTKQLIIKLKRELKSNNIKIR